MVPPVYGVANGDDAADESNGQAEAIAVGFHGQSRLRAEKVAYRAGDSKGDADDADASI